MKDKKFPKTNFAIAILCALLIIAFIVLFAVMENRNDRYFVAITATSVLLSPIIIVTLVHNLKYCSAYFKYKKVMAYGTDGTCNIFDFRMREYNGKKWNRKYSLILHYFENGVEKSFTTGYDFLEAEYKYLVGLPNISCRFFENSLFITENIPAEIYKNLTATGEVESKFVRGFMRVWQSIIAVISVAAVIVGIFLTIVTEANIYLIAGLIGAFSLNLACALVYAVCFFMGKF